MITARRTAGGWLIRLAEEGETIGTARLAPGSSGAVCLAEIFVVPEHRGRGHAETLVCEAIAYGATTAIPTSPRIRDLLKAAGWQSRNGIRWSAPETVRLPDGASSWSVLFHLRQGKEVALKGVRLRVGNFDGEAIVEVGDGGAAVMAVGSMDEEGVSSLLWQLHAGELTSVASPALH